MPYVYMVKDNKNRLYVGVSLNPDQRLKDHNHKHGAEFTAKGSFQIVFKEEYDTLSEARKREIQIKKWRRDKKENLINLYSRGLPTKK
ncbi:MAG: GIY-YIG nuclease family protein [Candidatus Staskawiczbacteria bacterium]|nr:GIY-YIG nuclease family protein [Candidatus Staskawiczbacteria bacterium]